MKTASPTATAIRRAVAALDAEAARTAADPPPAPAAPVGSADLAPVTRPNGEQYHPRQLAGGLSDVQMLRACRDATLFVMLAGGPGTGKTALVEGAFGEVVTVAGHADTLVDDLVGRYVQEPDGSYRWLDGPLPAAMKDGSVLFVDDATLIPPGVLARLYPAMDGRGVIHLVEHRGEAVPAAPGFFVVAAHNPGAPGAQLSEALSSRFAVHHEVRTDLAHARRLGVHRGLILTAAHLTSLRDRGEVSWAPEMRELLNFQRVGSVLGPAAAAENLVAAAPGEAKGVLRAALVQHRVLGP